VSLEPCGFALDARIEGGREQVEILRCHDVKCVAQQPALGERPLFPQGAPECASFEGDETCEPAEFSGPEDLRLEADDRTRHAREVFGGRSGVELLSGEAKCADGAGIRWSRSGLTRCTSFGHAANSTGSTRRSVVTPSTACE